MTDQDDQRPPGRPRSPDLEQRALAAVLDVFAEKGWTGLSIAEVAARARVGKSSLYLRWPNKTALLADALRQVQDTPHASGADGPAAAGPAGAPGTQPATTPTATTPTPAAGPAAPDAGPLAHPPAGHAAPAPGATPDPATAAAPDDRAATSPATTSPGAAAPDAVPGSLRDYLVAHAQRRADLYLGKDGLAMLRLYVEARAFPVPLAEVRHEAITRFVLSERQRVEQAIEDGELPAGTSVVHLLDAIEGSVLMHVLVTPPHLIDRVRSTLPAYLERMVDLQLAAAGAGPGPGPAPAA
ncbi:TetR/AcrR family transcriptional regulator [Cellulomonas sp. C5510]|uniref:TetR/AcrR family transcriptional regulator n=1 Tax=Cellulomonas sp. C5510 TaxID=2871170 RepID=UPI001C97F113|nr:TetR/AcrR family transcriptional regulator [Cellulomonas sp. C5510]QZN85935.1 TetR/AcrR family transcriptional regulator [Cellulomonas sp. C5510]